MTKDRMTVQEAARRLGVTDDAIRKRIQRGTLEHDKDPDGRVYVHLDATEDGSYIGQHRNASRVTTRDVTYDALLESLRDQVHYLRSVLEDERDAGRRADMIIAQLTQANAALAARVPELEPAQSAPPQRASEGSRGAAESGPRPRSVTQETSAGRREPWYRRWFGG
jgi:excisionase family DNA binding protein